MDKEVRMDIEREQWLEKRMKGIGGSDAGTVLGISPYKSRLELWTEKTTGVLKEKKGNVDLDFGKWIETAVIEEYIRKTKKFVRLGTVHFPEQLRSIDYPHMTANIDAVILDDIKGYGILEVKTKGAFVHWDENIPNYYYAQMMHYMAVSGFEWGEFCILDLATKKLLIHTIERDEDYINKLIEEEDKFWKLVTNKIPPAIDGSDACEGFLRAVYKTEIKGKEIDLTANEIATNYAFDLKDIKEQLKELKKQELLCENNLMNIMKDAEKGIGDFYKITWKSPQDSIVFNEDKFAIDHAELYKQYLKPKENKRRFSVRFTKEKE
jgi:putative phage-type endonuclease